MSLFKKVSLQGGVLVERDEKGLVTKKTSTNIVARTPAAKVLSWRSQMRQLTNGGIDTLVRLANIGNGVPQRTVLEDGTYTEWIVPSISEQRQALQFLAEFQLGKAVAQSEVMKAENEAEDQAQYGAMSDAALLDAARPYLERAQKKLAEGEEEEPEGE